jgi:ankyrin repeat protein
MDKYEKIDALWDALQDADFKKAESLVEAGADVDGYIEDDIGVHHPMIHQAAKDQRADILEFLIDNEADIYVENSMGMTALHLAVANSPDWELSSAVETLSNTDLLDCVDNAGQTPLYYASEAGSLELAGYFLEKGATLDARIIEISLDMGYDEMTVFLCRHAARDGNEVIGEIDIPDHILERALDEAVRSGDKDECIGLIAAGADPTPALFSVDLSGGSKTEMAEVLLKAGANLAAKDAEGMTAEDRAIDPDLKGLLVAVREERELSESSGKSESSGNQEATARRRRM